MDKKVYSICKLHTITDYTKFVNKLSGVIVRLGFRGNKSGTLCLDPKFEEFTGNFKRTDVPVGVSFFTNAINEDEAKEEADFIANAIERFDLQLKFPILINSDYARNDKTGRADSLTKMTRTKILLTIIRELKGHGYKAALYSTETWFNSVLDLNMTKDVNKVCIKMSGLTKPKVNDNLIAWEYKAGKIKGCDGEVKISHWYADIDEDAFRYALEAPEPPKKEEPVIVEPLPIVPEELVEEEEGFNIKVPGTELVVENVDLYANSLTSDVDRTISGTFYTWDSKVIRDRIRITDNIDNVGVENGYIGWVYVDDVIPEE